MTSIVFLFHILFVMIISSISMANPYYNHYYYQPSYWETIQPPVYPWQKVVLHEIQRPNSINYQHQQPLPNQVFYQHNQPPNNNDIWNTFDTENCGQTSDADKILGGNNTALDEFPWMVVLEHQLPTGQKNLGCAGSIINKQYILTAAHCLTGEILDNLGSLVNIRVGEWNTATNPDCARYPNNRIDCADPIVNISPEEIISHEEFNLDVNGNNDIGLIRLSQELEFTFYIDRVCLPSLRFRSSPGDEVMVSGWGKSETEDHSSVKQKLYVDVADQQYCANKFKTVRRVIKDSQMCAGGQFMKDTCQGDSGGPLMRLVIDGDVQYWVLEGVVSFGYNCGTEGWPAIYTRVTSYLDWIKNNIKN